LEVVENINQVWKLLILVKKESNGLRDPITSENYPKWINPSLVTILVTLGFEAETSQAINQLKERGLTRKKS
jgi:hypothetical protein